MIIEPIHFELKDGRKALLRSPEEGDIPEMLDFLYRSAGETEFIIRYPEECGKYTYEGEKELFGRSNDSPYEAMLVCIADGKIAGTSQITFNNSIKTKHRSNVAITLLREFWN
ncbi:MAG: hypothetical protein ACI4I8_02335 [Oscillospiraceae bacterium]